MSNQATFKTLKSAIQYWWVSLLLGVLFILLGLWVLKTPLQSYLALSMLFSISFFVSGIAEIFYAVSNKDHLDGWGWILTGGIVDLLIGILLIPNPALSMLILPYFIGFGVMFRSIMAVGQSFELKTYGGGEWVWLLLLGILGLLFSFILLWNPLFAGMTIVMWTALAFITIGIFRILVSFKLKKLHDVAR